MDNLTRKIFFLFLILNTSFLISLAQGRFDTLQTRLNELSKTTPGLKETVDLSFSNTPIQEFLKTMATNNNVNISVDPALNVKITNNFSNVTASDVLLFVCKKYDLDLLFIGNI